MIDNDLKGATDPVCPNGHAGLALPATERAFIVERLRLAVRAQGSPLSARSYPGLTSPTWASGWRCVNMCPTHVHDRYQRAIDLIRGFITAAEAQARGAALAIPVLSLELAMLELSANQHSYKED